MQPTPLHRTYLAASLVVLSLLICAPAFAVSVDQVPNPRKHNAWVSDTSNVIPDAVERRINNRLDQLEHDTGAEVALVTVDHVDTATPKDFATKLFNYWKIGKADKDNGLLILMVMGNHRLEMETGYGMEAVLPDGWLKRMQVAQMVPYFKQHRFGEGLENGVKAVAARIRRSQGQSAAPAGGKLATHTMPLSHRQPLGHVDAPSDDQESPWWLVGFLSGLAVVAGGGMYYKYRLDRTCPHCKLRMTMVPEDEDDDELSEGQQTEEALGSVDYQFYYCEECGFDRMLRDSKWFSGYSRCRQCGFKTSLTNSTVVRSPTTMSTGLKRIDVDCANCDYHSSHNVTIPRIQRTSSSSSGGFGGGGGSFGGGSSGGGGAGSSW